MALDKTGTLTEGRPSVVEVVPLAEQNEPELLARAAALEASSEHPLARAILAYARERGVEVKPAKDFQILQGKGATASLDGKEYWLGSQRYLEERGQETPEVHARLEAMSAAGRTAVVIGSQEPVCGLIAIADAVRPEAAGAVAALKAAGITKVVMLTGDNRGTAEVVGRETGIDEVKAELLPAEKVAEIDRLLALYGQVAMIGDGVNDAPAMAKATLSVAMGAAGSDAAIETADIALMSDNLRGWQRVDSELVEAHSFRLAMSISIQSSTSGRLAASLALLAIAASVLGVCFCAPPAVAVESAPSCHGSPAADGWAVSALGTSCCRMDQPQLLPILPESRAAQIQPTSSRAALLATPEPVNGPETAAIWGRSALRPDGAPPPISPPPCFLLPLRV